MNYLLLAAAIIALTLGMDPSLNAQTNSPEEDASHLEISVPEVTKTLPSIPTVESVSSPFPSPSPPVNIPSPSPNNLNNFRYPNASVAGPDSRTLILETNDSPVAVTNWYRNQLNNLHMNIRTYIQTSVNGNVSNKLTTSDGESSIEIDITKDAESSTTRISIRSID